VQRLVVREAVGACGVSCLFSGGGGQGFPTLSWPCTHCSARDDSCCIGVCVCVFVHADMCVHTRTRCLPPVGHEPLLPCSHRGGAGGRRAAGCGAGGGGCCSQGGGRKHDEAHQIYALAGVSCCWPLMSVGGMLHALQGWGGMACRWGNSGCSRGGLVLKSAECILTFATTVHNLIVANNAGASPHCKFNCRSLRNADACCSQLAWSFLVRQVCCCI